MLDFIKFISKYFYTKGAFLKLIEISINSGKEAEEPLTYYINEVLDIEQFAVEDKKSNIITKLYTTKELIDGIILNLEKFLKNLPDIGLDPGDFNITWKELEEEDWLYSWRKFFKPIEIDNKLRIRPSWEDKKDNMIDLIIDPKMGFGTGQHPTTYLCLKNLVNDNIKNKSIIDVGAGSGILSAAAILLGADNAVMVEKDPPAIESCNETVVNNGLENQSKVYNFDICKNEEVFIDNKFDFAFINIIVEIIVKILDLDFIQKIPEIYLSGIIEEKRSIIEKKIIDIGFEIEIEVAMGEWLFYKIIKK